MLHDRLKKLRLQQHLSQMALSKIIGVSQQTVGSRETGRTSPDNNMITTLAKHFHVSTDYLLGNAPTNNINIETNNGAGHNTKNRLMSYLRNATELTRLCLHLTICCFRYNHLKMFCYSMVRLYVRSANFADVGKIKKKGDYRMVASAHN